jgi:hypothetical protein
MLGTAGTIERRQASLRVGSAVRPCRPHYHCERTLESRLRHFTRNTPLVGPLTAWGYRGLHPFQIREFEGPVMSDRRISRATTSRAEVGTSWPAVLGQNGD